MALVLEITILLVGIISLGYFGKTTLKKYRILWYMVGLIGVVLIVKDALEFREHIWPQSAAHVDDAKPVTHINNAKRYCQLV